jgi:hypothetical protein
MELKFWNSSQAHRNSDGLMTAQAISYKDWASDQRPQTAELGTELRSIMDALGLECEQSGLVHGAAISD